MPRRSRATSETPLVGRERERQRLWRDYEDAVADRTCRLFTLLGPAGIGKSRLVADFLERVGDSADVLRGRCLSYGEGITYWPLVEILLAIGVDPEDVIGTSPPETQLAFRRLLEARAAERPQVVVIDDLQWAEPVFVDLVEHVADLSRDAPIFLLCIARTELLDARPGLGRRQAERDARSCSSRWAPDECAELMDRLERDARSTPSCASASRSPPPATRSTWRRCWRWSASTAVTARSPCRRRSRRSCRRASTRSTETCASSWSGVRSRARCSTAARSRSSRPIRSDLRSSSHLATLVRKELIRSTPPTFPEDEGFRFRHLLIRDAAYESLPKATRAELHERFADWLAGHDLVERDEIVGYHLEQAHRYRAELDPDDPRSPDLGGRRARAPRAPAGARRSTAATSAPVELLRRGGAILAPRTTRGDTRSLPTSRSRSGSRETSMRRAPLLAEALRRPIRR